MTDEPRHVLKTPGHHDAKERNLTWCGQRTQSWDWAFNDASHAALAGDQRSLIQACPACTDAIIEALRRGADPEMRP